MYDFVSVFNSIICRNMKSISLNSIVRLTIIILIFLIVFLPSGSIGGLNVKVLSMVALVFGMVINVFSIGKINKRSLNLIGTFAISFLFVIFNYMTASSASISRGYATTEGMLFITYFLSTAALIISISEGFITKEDTIKTILYSCAVYSLIKILITILSMVGFISIYMISDFIYQSYGIKPMLFPITDTLSRFQLANDYIVCFSLYFIICKGNALWFIKKRVISLIKCIFILGVLISFSRYMISLLLVGVAINVSMGRSISSKSFIAASFLIFISLTGYLVNIDSINDAVSLRFSSDANDVSDTTRVMQIECLSKAFDRKPLSGYGGLGDFYSSCPGPRGAEFSYEVQYLGFLYRFGGVQTALIVFLYFSQFKISITGSVLRKENIPSIVAFLCWMMIGFFNPYLISGYASVIMVLCVCLTGKITRDKSLRAKESSRRGRVVSGSLRAGCFSVGKI